MARWILVLAAMGCGETGTTDGTDPTGSVVDPPAPTDTPDTTDEPLPTTDTPTDGVDSDSDGTPDAADCAPTDPSVHPGATDVPYDGVDQDCSGGSDNDADGDGYDDEGHGGDDCDDTNENINPGVSETWYDGVDQNCDGLSDWDADLDGHEVEPRGGDCNDLESSIHPGALDAAYDGVDANCLGDSDYDADADGYDSDDYGGTDCDDLNATVSPGGIEVLSDGIDQDCSGIDLDGTIVTVDDLLVGDLVISEIHHDALAVDDLDGEWFEFYNGRADIVDLFGLTIQGGAPNEMFDVDKSVLVEPGGFVVFGRVEDPAVNGGLVFDYVYEREIEFDEADQLSLTRDFTFLDVVNIGPVGITSPEGSAVSLDPDHMSSSENGLATNWCPAVTPYGDGDLGTPGAANPQCP